MTKMASLFGRPFLLLSVFVSDFHSILRFELVGAAELGSFYFLFEAELA